MELVDLDTEAFNRIMDCLQLPKNTSEEQLIREKQLNKATISSHGSSSQSSRTCP